MPDHAALAAVRNPADYVRRSFARLPVPRDRALAFEKEEEQWQTDPATGVAYPVQTSRHVRQVLHRRTLAYPYASLVGAWRSRR